MTNTIQDAIRIAQQKMNSATPELDARLIVASVIKKDRTFCYTYPETELTEGQQNKINALVEKRSSGVPMAYLLHEKEFWSRTFIVTEDCLIPRPETELIIEWCLQNCPKDKPLKFVDLGTGSGAIGVTLAAECKKWHVSLVDISEAALHIAKQNAIRHADTTQLLFYHGEWFEPLGEQQFDVIISNPPYVAELDDALQHEPQQALYAEEKGLKELKKIIKDSPQHLKPNGYLILEHGSEQQKNLVTALQEVGYNSIQTFKDFSQHDRMIVACLNS